VRNIKAAVFWDLATEGKANYKLNTRISKVHSLQCWARITFYIHLLLLSSVADEANQQEPYRKKMAP
jgi:hypothetical protein